MTLEPHEAGAVSTGPVTAAHPHGVSLKQKQDDAA